jgi:type IV pilus assembly protein PilY1
MARNLNRALSLAVLWSIALSASAGHNLGSTPLYLGASVQPIVMLTMPKDIQIYQRAYNDFSDLDGDGIVDSTYKHSINYYGYFDSFKCYTYDTTNHRFNPVIPQPANTPTDKYCTAGAGQWSGNFLNWATMTRIDIVRKVLYGGKRVTDTQVLTVLERETLPTDAETFSKFYGGGAANDISRLTPFNLSNAAQQYASTTSKTVKTVSQITVPASGTTATVTASGHGFATGSTVVITGSNVTGLNGTFSITVSNANVFTYTLPAAISTLAINSNNAGISTTVQSTTMAVTNSGATRNIIVGDQIAAGAATAALFGVVTAASGTSITFRVDGTFGGSAAAITSWTVTNLSSNGITICNVSDPSPNPGNTETLNTSTVPPLMRVVAGNHSLWDTLNARDCVWSSHPNADNASGNGNKFFYSEIASSQFPPAQTLTTAGGIALGTGFTVGEYAVRVQVCNASVLGLEKCQNYPGNPATSGGVWKPVGLLQDYASGNNRKIKFGMFTGSYSRNLSGGVLRKNAGFLDTANPVGTAAPAAGDEIDTRDGTFVAGSQGIIPTLTKLRVFGYDYTANVGKYGADSDGCNQPGLLAPGLSAPNFAEGQCASWGNPLSEIFSEAIRYLAGKTPNTAFTPTPPAAGAFSSGGLTDDNILGLAVQGWQDPLASGNFCAPLNVVVFNASVNTYDNNQVDISSLPGAPDAKVQTKNVGIAEGITAASQFLIGDNGAGNATQTCTPKLFSGANGLGDVNGICPEAPIGLGTYLISGAAYWAHTNKIRTDLTPPATDTKSLKVKTYGVALNTATPKILIPVPGTGALASPPGSVAAKFITVLPSGKTLNSGSYRGPATITNFKIVRQDLAAGTGKFFVSWEDSQNGNDHELDQWGVIAYQFLNSNTQIQVTTQVVFASAGFTLGFGFIIAGTQGSDGEHFLSAHLGNTTFNFTAADGTVECTNCQESDGPRSRTFNVAAGTSATVLNDPLFYAAKYGGFTDLNGNNIPDQVTEWDNLLQNGSPGQDGLPDNYFAVTNPAGLEASMDRAFIYILQVSSASSVATNSTSLTTGSRVYQARFNSNEWSGQLLSFTIDVNGVIDPTPNFDAGQKMPGFNTRTIITLNQGFSGAGNAGLPFRWNNLTAAEQNFLRMDGGSGAVDATTTVCTADNTPVGCTDRGPIRLNYLRGDQSNEGATATKFRVRPTTVLGDIVDSTPRYVGPPSASFSDPGYLTFRSTYSNRTPMLYVGSNGGMFHAFEATTGANGGVERLAYVPWKMYPNLTKLTSKTYSHRYYVDGSPSVNDACFGACASGSDWHTVAVGGYNAGGQGYYALDVTNPAMWTESNAGSIVLWEFTDVDDPDLGFTFSKPQIAKMQNGRWAAIFGNGYNSTTAATGEPACTGGTGTLINPYTPAGCSVGLTGYAVLYIVFLDGGINGVWTQGSSFIKISTNTSTNLITPSAFTPGLANGLATPAVMDTNGDGSVDTIYAGDLMGNLWKFDVSSASPSSWGVASAGIPLFTAVDAAGNREGITTAPVLSLHPSGGVMVLFGTGKYLEQTDDSPPFTQNTEYGIWDKLDNTTVTRADLMQQKVLNVTGANPTGGMTVSGNTVRLTSAYLPNYTATTRTEAAGSFGDADTNPNSVSPTATTPPQRGWLLDFPNSGDGSAPNAIIPGTGERAVFDPLLTTSKLVFTTLLPSTVPCQAGGTSFVMDMDPTSGSRLTFSPFDINGDNNFSSSDFVTYGGVAIAVTGLGSTIGIVPQPTVIAAQPGKEVKVLSGSSGGLQAVLENAPGSTPTGARASRRITWRELLSN